MRDMDQLHDAMEEKGVEAIIVKDSELEVYDGELEQVNVESGEEVLERFTGDLDE